MFRHEIWLSALLALIYAPAAAQDLRREFRPELDLYVNAGSRTRFIFQDSLNESGVADYYRGNFAYFVEIALRPIFRRELRQQPDVFRNRYLTFRAGYQYSTTLTNGNASWENRAIVETTGRYPLPHGFVVRDRNRGELRFVEGRSVSSRYRNRLWVEHDLNLKPVALTPYIYDEVFFDTRYHAWSSNRIALGLQAQIQKDVVVEPYLLRQVNYQGSPRHIQAVGIQFNLYF